MTVESTNTKVQALKTALDNRYAAKADGITSAERTKLSGIAEGANAYTHPTYTSQTSGLYKITVDGTGHVSATTAVQKSDIDTLVGAATQSTAGLMSAADKTALDGMANAGAITVAEASTPTTGYLKSYEIKQGNTLKGTIDIPKDFLVKSGTVKTVGSTPTSAETGAGLTAGQKYISLIINSKDAQNSTGDEELIIPATGLVDIYTGKANQVSISNANEISIASGGVGSTELASNAVTTAKITDANITTAKIADANVTNAKLAADVQQAWDSDIEDYLEALTTALTPSS